MSDFVSQIQSDELIPDDWPPCRCTADAICHFCQWQDQAELDYLNRELAEQAELVAEPDEQDEFTHFMMMMEG